MFRNLGPGEIVLILLVLILLFGANKLPKLGRSVGEGIREFKKSINSAGEETPDEDSKKQ